MHGRSADEGKGAEEAHAQAMAQLRTDQEMAARLTQSGPEAAAASSARLKADEAFAQELNRAMNPVQPVDPQHSLSTVSAQSQHSHSTVTAQSQRMHPVQPAEPSSDASGCPGPAAAAPGTATDTETAADPGAGLAAGAAASDPVIPAAAFAAAGNRDVQPIAIVATQPSTPVARVLAQTSALNRAAGAQASGATSPAVAGSAITVTAAAASGRASDGDGSVDGVKDGGVAAAQYSVMEQNQIMQIDRDEEYARLLQSSINGSPPESNGGGGGGSSDVDPAPLDRSASRDNTGWGSASPDGVVRDSHRGQHHQPAHRTTPTPPMYSPVWSATTPAASTARSQMTPSGREAGTSPRGSQGSRGRQSGHGANPTEPPAKKQPRLGLLRGQTSLNAHMFQRKDRDLVLNSGNDRSPKDESPRSAPAAAIDRDAPLAMAARSATAAPVPATAGAAGGTSPSLATGRARCPICDGAFRADVLCEHAAGCGGPSKPGPSNISLVAKLERKASLDRVRGGTDRSTAGRAVLKPKQKAGKLAKPKLKRRSKDLLGEELSRRSLDAFLKPP